MTVMHEIFHVLLFSSTLYPLYPSGNPMDEFDVVDSNGDPLTVTKATSPGVKAFGAAHLNCPLASFDGWTIENGGGIGSAGSHWD